jgi:two-component system, LuxR family, response regulator FixJ
MKSKVQVYIVEDDDAVRESLSFQLETAGYQVTEFSSGLDFLRVAPALDTGCLILDVRMPEIDGMDLQSRLNSMKISFPVIMMTGHGDVALAVRAMKAGAIDFVEKPFSEETILESIGLALRRIRRSGKGSDDTEVAMARLAPLSSREREVMEGLVAGQPNKLIAFELGLSPRTVEVHRSRVMDKTQTRNVSELVRLALAAGVQIRA